MIFMMYLKDIRRELGMSQKHMADVLGIKPSRLSMIESGKRYASAEITKKLSLISKDVRGETEHQTITEASLVGEENKLAQKLNRRTVILKHAADNLREQLSKMISRHAASGTYLKFLTAEMKTFRN